ncbi:baculoviral IAP repeat-containing protein 3-like [Cloeon dipterum]|uniref:baculoviral IAP repeat-containing protein 3-like n=1 Tax=Cloeon dipterum TaxID=197152 RepID=UPI0032200693
MNPLKETGEQDKINQRPTAGVERPPSGSATTNGRKQVNTTNCASGISTSLLVTAESSRTPPTNAPPAHPIIDENPHAPNLNLNLAMHRYFTFPLIFLLTYKTKMQHMLADLGLYFLIDGGRALLRCQFCELIITAEQFQDYFGKGIEHARKIILGKKFNCSIIAFEDSKNVPMGEDVDSVLNYKFEAHRLYSLMKKTDWMFVEPFGLAKSGFYYTGDGDNVMCIFCNLEVRGWEEGDTADGEHRRWNSNCPFLYKRQSVQNIALGSESAEMNTDSIGTVHKGAKPLTTNEQPPAPVMGNQDGHPPAAVPQDEAAAPQGGPAAPQDEPSA